MKLSDIQNIIEKLNSNNTGNDPNIFIAAYFWDKERLHAAKTCYQFMRIMDDLIDNKKAEKPELTCIEKKLLSEKIDNLMSCLGNKFNADPLISNLIRVIHKYKIPISLFHRFAQSMRFDIENNGFSTFDEFIEYSEGASVAPAAIFVHFCGLQEINGKFFPPDFNVVDVARPCALFSYIVHIIRDFQEDQLNNLNYFAHDILKKYNINNDDLRQMAIDGKVTDEFRQVVKEYHNRAEIYGSQTMLELMKLQNLDEKYLFSLYLIFNLYTQIFDRIDLEEGNFTTQEMKPTAEDIGNNLKKIIIENFLMESPTI